MPDVVVALSGQLHLKVAQVATRRMGLWAVTLAFLKMIGCGPIAKRGLAALSNWSTLRTVFKKLWFHPAVFSDKATQKWLIMSALSGKPVFCELGTCSCHQGANAQAYIQQQKNSWLIYLVLSVWKQLSLGLCHLLSSARLLLAIHYSCFLHTHIHTTFIFFISFFLPVLSLFSPSYPALSTPLVFALSSALMSLEWPSPAVWTRWGGI